MEDLPAILDFIDRTYGDGAPYKDSQRLIWQFFNAPFRHDTKADPTIWIATSTNNRVVGTIGTQDSLAWLKGRSIPASWIVDVMVDPSYRGCGLGHRIHASVVKERPTLVTLTMAQATRRIAERAGALTLDTTYQFACPARLSGRTVAKYLRAKSRHRRRLAPFLKAFAGSGIGPSTIAAGGRILAAIAGSSRSTKPHARFTVEEIDCFPSSYDEFWTRVRALFPAIFDRSSTTLNWRFCTCPQLSYRRFLLRRDGKICGYVVTRVGEATELPIGVIADLLAAPGDSEALDALLAVARGNLIPHCEYLEAAASTPAFVSALKRAGFIQVRTMRPTIVCTSPELREELSKELNSWHFTKGDHDWDQVHPV